MRVLQVSDGYPPATGGLERVVAGLSQELAARGHEVHVATLGYPGAPAFEREGPVAVHRLEGWTRHLQRFSADPGHHFHPTARDPQLVRRLQALVDELAPDIVHAHGWILHSALELRLPRGTPLVVTLHDYSVTCARKTMIHGSRQGDELDSVCTGRSLRRCLPCATAFYGPAKGVALTLGLAEAQHRYDRVAMFLPISDAVARACVPDVEPARVTVIPSFVADDVASVAADRPDFLRDGEFVLFVGALGEHKGVGLLAEAHRRSTAGAPLVVIGSRRADTPAFGPGVVVRDGVPHAQIMAAFAAAAVVAVPSRWPEPQGLVAIEAMAAGRPVVASRVGGLAEIVTPGTGLLVEPGDADALAEALDELLADPAGRAGMAAACRARARDFTASTVLPRVLDAYERAVTSR